MQVEFSAKFSKDLDALHNKSLRESIHAFILLLETADSPQVLPNTKQLKGYKTAFRTRFGDYRLGFFFEDSVITIGRIIHRKDIYRYFP